MRLARASVFSIGGCRFLAKQKGVNMYNSPEWIRRNGDVEAMLSELLHHMRIHHCPLLGSSGLATFIFCCLTPGDGG